MHKQLGFTIVELMIVIIVLAILATLGGLAWRGSMNTASDNANRSGALTLRDGLERYHNKNGEYPEQLSYLVHDKFLSELPTDTKGRQFSYQRRNIGAASAYAILVPQSSGDCKTGKLLQSDWFPTVAVCSF